MSIFLFSGQLGDVKLEDLPGPEALLRPGENEMGCCDTGVVVFFVLISVFSALIGNSSGQTKLIRRGNVIECHQVRLNSLKKKSRSQLDIIRSSKSLDVFAFLYSCCGADVVSYL